MGLQSWLARFQSSPEKLPAIVFDPDLFPYGLNKRAADCTIEDIKESTKKFRDDNEDILEGFNWKLVSGLDYKSTLLELALHGQTAAKEDDLPLIPAETGYRIQGLCFDPEDPFWSSNDFNVKVVADTPEELQKITGAVLYKTKTKKKETGKCYFIASVPLKAKPEEQAGIFLRKVNKLTRRLVLGEELAIDFELAMMQKIDPQDWINNRLGYLRKSR
ncbi:hypothetical protein N9T98_00035 [bacterium]|nr:hypothetical protein [bacterium]